MTALIVALLTLPLAALRPYQQPTANTAAAETLPESFKVSISEAAPPASPAASAASVTTTAKAAQPAGKVSLQSRWSCDSYPMGTSSRGTSTHISSHNDGDSQILEFLVTTAGRCTEAAVLGKALFSPDETHIAQLAPGGFARFRERTPGFDRAVSITPVGDGSLKLLGDGRWPVSAFRRGNAKLALALVCRKFCAKPASTFLPVSRVCARRVGFHVCFNRSVRSTARGSKRAHYEDH